MAEKVPVPIAKALRLVATKTEERTESKVAVNVTAALAIVMEVKMTRPDSTDGPEFRDEFGGREPASDTDAFGGPEPADDTDAFGGPEPASDTDAFGGPEPASDTDAFGGPEPADDTDAFGGDVER